MAHLCEGSSQAAVGGDTQMYNSNESPVDVGGEGKSECLVESHVF